MKQIKTLALAALLLLATGCADERDNGDTGNIAPGTPVEINFDAPTVASNGSATRAAVALPTATTVRITPYNKTKSRYETSVTYYVGTPADGKGKLIPYTSQNADGTFVTGNKMKVIMSDTYLFYISTPAKDITSEGYKQTVGNNEDFASAVSGDVLITGNFVTNNFCPTLPTLVRRCAQVTIKVAPSKPGSMKIASAPGGARLSGLRSAQAGIAPGVAIPTTGGTNDQSYTVTTIKSESTSLLVYGSFCVLPGLSSADLAVQLIASLQPDGVNVIDKTVTYATKINFTEPLKPGYKYEIQLTVDIENAEVLPTVTVTDWEDAGDVPKNNYPFVATNPEGKRSVIVVKDLFGQATPTELFGGPLLYSFHEPWLQSPTFSAGTMGSTTTEEAGVSPMFEVAQTDASTIEVYVGMTNGLCVAPWRRPTILELRVIQQMHSKKLLEVGDFQDYDGLTYTYGGYFSATMRGEELLWVVDINNKAGSSIKSNYGTIHVSQKGYDRCVRDFGIVSPNYAHVKDGKFIISQDEYGTTAGTFHPKWGSNDVPLHYKEDTQYNTVSARFEVSEMLSEGESGNEAKELCAAHSQPSGAAGTWRVPTMAEFFLMYDLRAQLPEDFFIYEHISSTHRSKTPGEENWYWGFNPTWQDGYIGIFNGVVRCVRDY